MEHRVTGIGKCAEALPDDLLDALGDPDFLDAPVGSPHAVGALINRAAFDEAYQHLDGEERIAAGLLMEGDGKLARLLVELVPRGTFDEVADTVAVETAQRDALDAFGAAEMRQ